MRKRLLHLSRKRIQHAKEFTVCQAQACQKVVSKGISFILNLISGSCAFHRRRANPMHYRWASVSPNRGQQDGTAGTLQT
jgi:hypothetical protein